jgi:hypothetical protein
MAVKLTETKIKKKIGFDRMSMQISFPSGASLDYRIGRSGEKLAIAFSNDDAELKRQMKITSNWLKLRKGENNQQCFDRLEAAARKCKSGKEFINLITQ